MTYYILLDMDSIEDIWDENILGEESFGKFYVGKGYKALTNMINKEPEVLESIAIIDEKKNILLRSKIISSILKVREINQLQIHRELSSLIF